MSGYEPAIPTRYSGSGESGLLSSTVSAIIAAPNPLLVGRVNSRLEAVVRVWIRGPGDLALETDATVDTGFSGTVSLPQEMVAELGLPPQGRMVGTLADGTRNFFPVYRAIILWHGKPQLIYVSAVESDPLIGMEMLHGSELAMQVVEDGEVYIREMQSS